MAQPTLQQLLSEANMLRLRGQREQAAARCQQAIALSPDSWEAQELLGDLLREMRMAEQAAEAYRQAIAHGADRALVEYKLARACVAIAQQRLQAEHPELLTDAGIPVRPRHPLASALLSAVVPGLGQIHNAQVTKGAALALAWLALLMAQLGSLIDVVQKNLRSGFDWGMLFWALWRPPGLYWTLLAIGLWLFAVVEAALVAQGTRTKAASTGWKL